MTTSLQVVLEHEIPQMGSVELRLELLAQLLRVVWVLDKLPDDAERPRDIALALTVFRWCNEHGLHIWHGLDAVKPAVARHPEIRRDLFWRWVEEHRQREG